MYAAAIAGTWAAQHRDSRTESSNMYPDLFVINVYPPKFFQNAAAK